MVQYFANETGSEKIGPDLPVYTYTNEAGIPKGTWARAWIDFSEFPEGVYDGFWFIDQAGSTQGFIYLDDITVYDFNGDALEAATTSADSSAGVVFPFASIIVAAIVLLMCI
jgi:hypothetical protein